MDNTKYNQSVEKADKAFEKWCVKNKIPLHGIQHVITWEKWDDGIGVYIFLNKINEVDKLKSNAIDKIKQIYIKLLKEYNYPFDSFPNVTFEIDSDENVRKNYGGSYFNRLR